MFYILHHYLRIGQISLKFLIEFVRGPSDLVSVDNITEVLNIARDSVEVGQRLTVFFRVSSRLVVAETLNPGPHVWHPARGHRVPGHPRPGDVRGPGQTGHPPPVVRGAGAGQAAHRRHRRRGAPCRSRGVFLFQGLLLARH